MTTIRHVLAVYEPSPRGREALRHAADIATERDARLTVVTVAVAEPTDRKCCDIRSVYWNEVVRGVAADELAGARAVLGAAAAADFRVVSGPSVPTAIAREADRCRADTVVVPLERRLLPWARMRRARQIERRAPGVTVVVASA